jgi:putative redox protein
MTLKAQLRWTEGLQFVARAGNGPGVVIDTHEGGGGPSPMDMVLMGVAGCTAVDVVSIMQKKRAAMTDFQVNIAGERAEDYPRRFTHIRIEYVLKGKGIKAKAVEQAIRLSETKYCSAMASLNATVEHTYRIVEDEA